MPNIRGSRPGDVHPRLARRGRFEGRILREVLHWHAEEVAEILEPWSLQVVEIADGRISGIMFSLDTARFFPLFGLPARLDA